MKFISWNVNGIRAVLKKGLGEFVRAEDPAVLCLQEVKAAAEEVETGFGGYQAYWNSAEKKGYSGIAIFTKTRPLGANNGMGIEKHDREGRVITLEYPDYYLVNVYTPNSKRGLERLPYREKEWDVDFFHYLKGLEKKKPVIFCGDLNVAHKEIDLTHPQANRRNHGFTDEERAGFDRFVKDGFLDAFREFTQEGGHYTWWSQMHRARERNIGWRIDYFLVSKVLRPRLEDAYLLPKVMGSDHCPVVMLLKDQ